MFNDKDFMGGMFDFDGNGKTTLDEQYVAYKIYEETIKEENDSSLSYHKPAKYSYTNNNTTNSKGTKGGTIIAVVAVIISLSFSLLNAPPPNVYWTNTYFFSGGFAVKVML